MKFLRAWNLETCGKLSWLYSSLHCCQCARYEGVWGSEAITHSFLTSLLDGGKRSSLNFGRFTSKNEFLRHPLKRRLELVRAFQGKKWLSCLYRESKQNSSDVQPVTYMYYTNWVVLAVKQWLLRRLCTLQWPQSTAERHSTFLLVYVIRMMTSHFLLLQK
jgi:hypothetical protein